MWSDNIPLANCLQDWGKRKCNEIFKKSSLLVHLQLIKALALCEHIGQLKIDYNYVGLTDDELNFGVVLAERSSQHRLLSVILLSLIYVCFVGDFFEQYQGASTVTSVTDPVIGCHQSPPLGLSVDTKNAS